MPRSTATNWRSRRPSPCRRKAGFPSCGCPVGSCRPGCHPPRAAANAASSLDALREAITGFDLCDLKKGARNTVFADGNPKARVLILGEAPGAEEDREGRPFVGRAGQLAGPDVRRHRPVTHQPRRGETALYITNVLPWRPPGNRDPEPAEIAMMLPFVERHIALVDPEVIVVVGNTPCSR
jgi:uracil-DNA glycosylase